jgi:hypothetical protein
VPLLIAMLRKVQLFPLEGIETASAQLSLAKVVRVEDETMGYYMESLTSVGGFLIPEYCR